MRKFLIPIVNLVNIILVSITFGLANNPAILVDGVEKFPYYQLVWNAAENPNIYGIIGFFIFIAAALFMLINFIPFRCRKYLAILTGGLFISAGVLFLGTPEHVGANFVNMQLSGSLIAMAVLVIIAGALSLVMSLLDFTSKKAE